jgi:hypothetical protein
MHQIPSRSRAFWGPCKQSSKCMQGCPAVSVSTCILLNCAQVKS